MILHLKAPEAVMVVVGNFDGVLVHYCDAVV
jgi:hypothetical protein